MSFKTIENQDQHGVYYSACQVYQMRLETLREYIYGQDIKLKSCIINVDVVWGCNVLFLYGFSIVLGGYPWNMMKLL